MIQSRQPWDVQDTDPYTPSVGTNVPREVPNSEDANRMTTDQPYTGSASTNTRTNVNTSGATSRPITSTAEKEKNEALSRALLGAAIGGTLGFTSWRFSR